MVPPCTSSWPLPTVTRTWKSTPPVPTRCSAPRSPWFPRNITCWRTPAEWPADVPEDWKGGYANPVEAVKAYRLAAEAKTAKDRVNEAGEKTGLFTGLYATNPITGAKLPLLLPTTC